MTAYRIEQEVVPASLETDEDWSYGDLYDDRMERVAAIRALHPRAYSHLDAETRAACERYLERCRRPWSDDSGESGAMVLP